MSPKRTLLLKKFPNGRNKRPQKNILTSLPSIAALPGEDFDTGIIHLDENRRSQVIRIKPMSFPISEDERDAFAAALEQLVRKSELDLQVVVISKLVNVDETLDGYNQARKQSNEYLNWFGDYTHKWFSRVAEVTHIPTREFFIVASTPRIAEAVSDESFERHAKNLVQHMVRIKLEPKVLQRCEVRRLLYSNLRLSAPDTSEQPAEMLNSSSIPDVEIQEYKNNLIVDKTLVATYTMADLASNVWQGWLAKLLMSPIKQYIASLHLQKCNTDQALREAATSIGSKDRKLRELEKDVRENTCTIVDASFHLAIIADAPEELEYGAGLVNAFSRKSALLQLAGNQQFDAWQSCLPLGTNKAGVSHRIKSTDAASLWLGYSDQTGTIAGFPLGFGRANEPVLFGPPRGSVILIVGSNEEERRFAQTILTIRMAVTDYSILQLSEPSHVKHILNAFGPGLSAVIGRDSIDDMSLLRATGFDKIFPLRCLDLSTRTERFPQSSLNKFAKVCRVFAESEDFRIPVISIPDLSLFAESAAGADELKQIIDTAQTLNAVLVVSSSTETLRRFGAIAEMVLAASKTRLVLPQAAEDVDYAREKLVECSSSSSLFSTIDRMQTPKNVWGYLTTSGTAGLIRMIMSPMEHWMYTHSSEDEAIREAMWEEVRTKNPKLSNTDTARQAVYYLGLQNY